MTPIPSGPDLKQRERAIKAIETALEIIQRKLTAAQVALEELKQGERDGDNIR